MRALWRRKIRIGRSPGISTVIGAIFFVIITLLITTNIFLWSIAKHNQYNQAVIQSNQMDADRINERIIITNGEYSIGSGQVRVTATLTNEGPVSSQIITLWVVDNTINSYNYISLKSPDINLGPGDTQPIDASVPILGCDAEHNYDIWFVTARGNRISFEKKQYVTALDLREAMGPIHIRFTSIKWVSGYGDPPYSGTYQIPEDKRYVTWSIDVTNYGVQDIKLSYDSVFGIIDLSAAGNTRVWYIGEDYTILVGKTVPILFWREAPQDPDGVSTNLPGKGTYATLVIFSGYYGDDPAKHYGQTIPFESIKVTD